MGDTIACAFQLTMATWQFSGSPVRTDLRTCPFKAARDGRMTLLRMSETTAAADSNETRKLCLLFVCSFLARSELEGKGGRPT